MLGCVLVAALPSVAAAEGPIKNGLSSAAFRRNGLTTNAQALQILMSHGLINPSLPSSQESYIEQQLQDPRAAAMLKEILNCALPAATSVTYGQISWHGELGLCPASAAAPGAPVWGPSGPNLACQQLVTACVAARVNALARSIPLSLRGESSQFSISDPASLDASFRESPPGQDPSDGIPIGSFSSSCAPGVECDWAPAYVGKCDPANAAPIRLSIPAPACNTTSLRVCAGIHGCFGPNAGYPMPTDWLDQQDPSHGQYWKLWKNGSACAGSAASFRCPTGGYYSVMVGPVSSGGGVHSLGPVAPGFVQKTGPGSYPAGYRDVFTFIEGGFYGNLFEPNKLTWSCGIAVSPAGGIQRVCTDTRKQTVETCVIQPDKVPRINAVAEAAQPAAVDNCVETKTVPYEDVYACYSLASQGDPQGNGSDGLGVAYLNDRICDDPNGSTCFPHTPQRCFFADPKTNQQFGAHCQWTGDGVFHHCGGSPGYLTVTSYLNDPCDVIRDPGVCDSVRRALAQGHPPRTRPGCGGCSAGLGGGLVPGALVVLGAMVRRRRRAR